MRLNSWGIGVVAASTFMFNQTLAESLPKPIEMLAQQGLTIVDTFEAPGGLVGYAARFQGQAIALYLTPDGEHVLIGNLLNLAGEDIAAEPLYQAVIGPEQERAWNLMANAKLVQDGDVNAPRVIYTVTDPNCPYCHRFREAAQPWIDAGLVQLRHLMVGIIREESLTQAAAIMGAPDPTAALEQHLARLNRGGIEAPPRFVRIGNDVIRDNHRIIRELGISATPVVYYRDNNNHVQVIRGMPQPNMLEAVFGPRP